MTIELLAYLTEGEKNLAGLWEQWTEQRTTLLRHRAGGPDLNAEVSFVLSINGRRMTDEARRLLSLLGVLPDGIAQDDLNALLPGAGEEAAATLCAVGLAFDEEARLRVPEAVRDHVRAEYAPRPDDLVRAAAHYYRLLRVLGRKLEFGRSQDDRRLAQ